MSTLHTAGAALHHESHGRGAPVTVFAHGMGASIAETRPLASGVLGTQTFLHFRGHGPSAGPDGRWDYDALAGDLRAVADEVGATRALGVSMGAAALLRLLVDTPDRFSRLVFFLPAVLDEPRSDVAFEELRTMADLVDAHDVTGLAALLLAQLPAAVRSTPAGRAYTAERARALVGTGVARLLRTLPPRAPLPDRAVLARVAAPALVVGQEGDAVHPASVAVALAAALPAAELVVFPQSGAMWEPTARRRLRSALSGFLNG